MTLVCFSVEADLAAAAALTPIAIVALRTAPTRRHLAIASLPAIFAVHQFIEAFVWLGFDGDVSHAVSRLAIHLYLVIAQVLLPILVPVALALTEPEQARRRIMLACAGVGVLVSARFTYIISAHEVGAVEAANVIIYRSDINIGTLAIAGYVIATCLPVLASSKRYLRLFGIVNVVGLSIATAIRYDSVTSVWCLYAALTSGLILLHLRAEARGHLTQLRSSPVPG